MTVWAYSHPSRSADPDVHGHRRLCDTPIVTFINKLDREGREPIDLLDEIEDVLKIQCAPIT